MSIKLYILAFIGSLLIGFYIGYLFNRKTLVNKLAIMTEIEKGKYDYLKSHTNELQQELDSIYSITPTANEVNLKYVYITKTKEIEKENYIKMDTGSRVSYFRKWLIDSTNKNIKFTGDHQ